MKLTIDQVHFLTEVLNSVNIPAKSARDVVNIQDTLSREFIRLQKIQEKENVAK